MWPVESDIANQIEEGYEYIKPWTPTYVEELNSCEEHGPEAELKIVHTLWPTEETPTDRSRPETAKSKRSLIVTATKELAPEGQERQQAIVVAEMTENKAAGVLDGFEVPGRLFAKSSIIYANGRDAQILKPNQLPSVSPKRSPLGNIRKGKAVGIPVVRGFDVKVWEKVHPPSKKIIAAAQARKAKKAIRKASTISPLPQDVCAACATPDQKPEPTDLVLVIHG